MNGFRILARGHKGINLGWNSSQESLLGFN